MTFLALITVLLLEYFRPLDARNPAALLFTRYANHLERHFNAGKRAHGRVAWLLGALLPAVAVGIVYGVLYFFSPLLALPFGVAVLYAVLSLKQIGVQAERIAVALRSADLDEARRQLAQWQGRPADDFESAEIARVGIEQTLACAHKSLFGVIAWFAVLGPAGAVLYRLSQLLSQKWGALDEREAGQFGQFATQIFELMDWVPLRLTAVSFAIVGDFEDAVYCWRSQASAWAQQGIGIVLASGAGALGVKLGEPLRYGVSLEFRPELGLGDEADADYLDSAVSLIWRVVVLWLVLLLLLTIAGWAGG
ncbi:MAG: CobD/CbiB family protein [Sulfuricella sp.]|nr:CobD/CbiB family protein [Sulfuricella sp.]